MATADGTESESTRQMRQVSARLSPLSRFPVPRSDGYSVYSALLSKLSGVDEDVGRSVHESPLGSLHSSGLLGTFGQSDRAYHKTLLPNETYDLSLGIVHPDDTAGRNREKSRAGIETGCRPNTHTAGEGRNREKSRAGIETCMTRRNSPRQSWTVATGRKAEQALKR